MSNASLAREYAQYKNERKMDELAIKGYQNQIAEKLRGSMGEEIKHLSLIKITHGCVLKRVSIIF